MNNILAKCIPRTPASMDELDKMRKRLWKEQGYLLIRPEDCKDDWELLFFKNKGDELYGKHYGK